MGMRMSDKYQREIEEILQQAGGIGPDESRGPMGGFLWLVWSQLVHSVGGKVWSLRPGRVMLLAMALLFLALTTYAFGLGVAGLLGWTGLVLFIVGYAMFFIRLPKTEPKRWRGQPIDYGEKSWFDRLRQRMR